MFAAIVSNSVTTWALLFRRRGNCTVNLTWTNPIGTLATIFYSLQCWIVLPFGGRGVSVQQLVTRGVALGRNKLQRFSRKRNVNATAICDWNRKHNSQFTVLSVGTTISGDAFNILKSCCMRNQPHGSVYRFTVSDSTTNTWGDTITGGGQCRVGFCDGANWTVYGK